MTQTSARPSSDHHSASEASPMAAATGSLDAFAALAASLPLEDKVRLLTGHTAWRTHAIESIGLRSMGISDGPVGVRGTGEIPGVSSALMPAPSALAATWDLDAAARAGLLFATEARRLGVDIVLAPQVNLQRTPVGGRHFECYSEDPLLTSAIAGATVAAMQAAGVAACLKHFVANDSETARTEYVSVVDEQALREVYLAPFDYLVHEVGVWSVMAAYNGVEAGGETSPDDRPRAPADGPAQGRVGLRRRGRERLDGHAEHRGARQCGTRPDHARPRRPVGAAPAGRGPRRRSRRDNHRRQGGAPLAARVARRRTRPERAHRHDLHRRQVPAQTTSSLCATSPLTRWWCSRAKARCPSPPPRRRSHSSAQTPSPPMCSAAAVPPSTRITSSTPSRDCAPPIRTVPSRSFVVAQRACIPRRRRRARSFPRRKHGAAEAGVLVTLRSEDGADDRRARGPRVVRLAPRPARAGRDGDHQRRVPPHAAGAHRIDLGTVGTFTFTLDGEIVASSDVFADQNVILNSSINAPDGVGATITIDSPARRSVPD